MDKQDFQDYIDVGYKVGLLAVVVIYFRRITKGIWAIFAGPDALMDKKEFGAMVMLFWGSWMIWKEGHREHEWHLFNELYILIVFSMAAFGLGMKSVADTIIKWKHGGGKEEEPKNEEK